ncbi:colicin E3/pyocin S6 family cytotoxin, partial [Xanthomonas oryzae]|uniref:colicin E3/pyocin S6 family cytotoxin n=3 Tax=Xanthomonas oryzae TaxID=347 RepID=UPI001C4A335C
KIVLIRSAVAADNGLVKDNKLTRMNGRDVYRSEDGSIFAVDSQHGRFEVVDAKTGKHLGEVDFSLSTTKPAARDKSHDLKVK